MATKIKNDLKEEYQGIKYILTSTMRTKLLLSIYNESKNLDDLRIELKKPSATILHGLKELENLNFVKTCRTYGEHCREVAFRWSECNFALPMLC